MSITGSESIKGNEVPVRVPTVAVITVTSVVMLMVVSAAVHK